MAAQHPTGLPPPGQRDSFQGLAEVSLKIGETAKAIQYAAKELAIDERFLQADAKNTNAQHNQAVANRQIGGAHELIAQRKALPPSERRTELREAGVWYGRSQDILLALNKAGTLAPTYLHELTDVSNYMANCDKALAAIRID